uniref:Oxysterol-binding protein n=1 Tax=Caenorhabditis tropicalis TaxID=1561998 RepID=A0A1I7TR44_9PELO
MLNGRQNAEKLFESMIWPNKSFAKKDDPAPVPELQVDSEEDLPERERIDYEQPIPFSSATELFSFLNDCIPIFRYRPAIKQWQNNGVQTRRFVQWLKNEMDSVIHRFKETINVPDEQRAFAERECFFDYSSYQNIKFHIPGFEYDSKSQLLSLLPVAASRIALVISILTSFLTTNTGLVMDCSREWSGFITPYRCSQTGTSHGIGVTGEMEGLTTRAFDKHFLSSNLNPTFCGRLVSASGYLWPGSSKQTAEVYQLELARVDYFQNMSGTFKTAEKNNYREEHMLVRPKPTMKSKKEIEEVEKEQEAKRNARRAELMKRLAEALGEEKEEEGTSRSTSTNPFDEDHVDFE